MQAKKICALFLFSFSSLFGTHIAVNNEIPGIAGLFDFRPDTGDIIKKLVGALLYKESTLARSERELIAAYVSWLNECKWCCSVHSSVAAHLPGMDAALVQAVKENLQTAPISEKLKSLLNIASSVQKEAARICDEAIERARAAGATDQEIHDVVLIAAVFCMNNRYVMCLDARTPDDPIFYEAIGAKLAEQGYQN